MKGIKDALSGAPESGDTTSAPSEPTRSQRSPLMTGGKGGSKASDSLVVKGTEIPLPVTGGSVYCPGAELDPADCFVSGANPRRDELLDPNDPFVASLIKSIETEGQRDPVLARLVQEGGETKYEVIYGKTRLYVVRFLNKSREEPLKLKAWLGVIPAADVRPLAIGENMHRRDISAYERGLDLKYQREQGVYKGKSLKEIGVMEGVSESEIHRYISIGQLPFEFLQLMDSPQTLRLGPGSETFKHWQHARKLGVTVEDVVAAAAKDAGKSGRGKFEKGVQLQKLMRRIAQAKERIAQAKEKKTASESNKGGRPKTNYTRKTMSGKGGATVTFSQNRKDKMRFKIDLVEIPEDVFLEVEKAVADALKLKD
ncbi:hypothetical protein A3709_20690 [Halioglobus sp. HI00S01]|uniref:ParB/RepB/Spo0J family partition protein n=1 Tax=Halioglobus sp. HI00S01 TaxID=1822214 RepID=UPI0007C3639F|nr:ParB N-terminal domain-containing protein [Halioglobus sp. HI00S01]KZX58032.1 hypothetical protein A3709_20690 [Halioglobus sp. HI00S01]